MSNSKKIKLTKIPNQMKINLLLVFLLSFGNFIFAQDAPVKAPPNVILIVVDDMGWNDVSYHGSEVKTPTMDRLATEGVELNRFYVHPACSPTRSSLMTGKTAVRLGFVNPLGKNNMKGLPLSEKIMPQYFKENGYYKKTALLKSAIAKEQKEQDINNEKIISSESSPEPIKVDVPEEKKQVTLDYVRSPYSDMYNFVSKDNILIE